MVFYSKYDLMRFFYLTSSVSSTNKCDLSAAPADMEKTINADLCVNWFEYVFILSLQSQ